MKWKWPELRSVDLQVKINASIMSNEERPSNVTPISLLATGPDNVRIDCTARGVSLARFDTYRLLADLEAVRNSVPMGYVCHSLFVIHRFLILRSINLTSPFFASLSIHIFLTFYFHLLPSL
jgi:hypothetical protein